MLNFILIENSTVIQTILFSRCSYDYFQIYFYFYLQFSCAASIDTIVQRGSIIHSKYDLNLFTCRCSGSQGKVVPQVVVLKDPSVDDPCSFNFTGENWQQGTQIPLLASSDMLYDKVQDVNLSMVVEKYSDGQLLLTRQMTDIKVNLRNTSFCALSIGNVCEGQLPFEML